MSLKAYIPGTQARRDRLYSLSLQKRLGKHEVLLQLEWPDGTESFRPANWDPEISAWVTDNGMRFYSVGRGGNANSMLGVPIVHVDAENAGVVSADAAKAARREDELEYVDADGRPLEVTQTDDEGEPLKVKYADEPNSEPIAADGGEIELHYDFGAPNGMDGEVIDRRLAGQYDPFPVSRKEADQAVEHAISAVQDQQQNIKLILIGVAIGVGIPILLIILVWLLGQIGGGGGGGSVIPMIAAMGGV